MSKSLSMPVQGILWCVCYCLCAAIMIGMIRYISIDVHPTVILFFRNFLALIIFVPWLLKSKINAFKTSRLKLHLLRCAVGLTAMGVWFYAITLMPLGEAVALNFTAPLFATAIAILFLQERVSAIRIISLVIGFAGACVILRPGIKIVDFSVLLVLGASFLMAISGIIIKILVKTDSPKVTVFYFTLFSTPIAFMVSLPYFQWPSIYQLIWLFGIAVFATLMQISLSKALSLSDISMITPFDFLRLVFTSIIAFIAFDEILDIYTIIGAIVIISSATILAHKEVSFYKSKVE